MITIGVLVLVILGLRIIFTRHPMRESYKCPYCDKIEVGTNHLMKHAINILKKKGNK